MHELFGPETDSHELATKRREAILNDAEFLTLGALAKPLERFRDDDLWARLTRYLDFENADKTSNHAERENREFRKRQKTHYRMRSRESLRALLALLSVRRPVPTAPVKLIRRERSTTNEEELVA
jgi:hypothetical protein